MPDADPALPELELKKAQGAAGLSPAARRVHREVLRGFVRTGRPPSRAELRPVGSPQPTRSPPGPPLTS